MRISWRRSGRWTARRHGATVIHMTTAAAASPAHVTSADLTRTARITGLLYLGLAVTGTLGFLMVRGRIFVADDPAATMANLTSHISLARIGVALELGIVMTQALAATYAALSRRVA